jgi:hypothetical protein
MANIVIDRREYLLLLDALAEAHEADRAGREDGPPSGRSIRRDP